MDTVRFLGRSIPELWRVNIGTPVITLSEPPLDFEARLQVRIIDSKVEIECQMETYSSEQYNLLYIRALDQARAVLDLFSFAAGVGQALILDEFIDEKGNIGPVYHLDQTLSARCTAYRVNAPFADDSFDEVYRIVVSDFELFIALRDLIDAFKNTHSTTINCGRVLDGIKRMISPGEKNQNKAWSAMQKALNIDRSYQQWITDMSANPRHADRSYVPGVTTLEIIQRTWTIMNRLLEYKKRRNITLTAPEFPTLTP